VEYGNFPYQYKHYIYFIEKNQMELLHTVINYLVEVVWAMGYIGIFVLMFLESSFFPFPSEVVMIPAWYLAYQWEMNIYLVILIWLTGSLAGAWFNYLLASKFWRKFLEKFIEVDKLDKLDTFFDKHWPISTFNWRLIPVVRQYISFPAGLSKMNWWKFTIYTALWAWIWVTVLALLWYFLGKEENLRKPYLKEITIITIIFIIILSVWYYYLQKRKSWK